MKKKYKNIVVGAGIGGLIVSGYLAKAGEDTLVIEKKSKVGGRINITRHKDVFGQDQGPVLWTAMNGGFWVQAGRDLGADLTYTCYPPIGVYIKDSKIPVQNVVTYNPTAESLTEHTFARFPKDAPETTKDELYKIFKEIIDMKFDDLVAIDNVRMKDWILERTDNKYILDHFIKTQARQHMITLHQAEEMSTMSSAVAIIRTMECGEGFLTIIHPNPVDGMSEAFKKADEKWGVEFLLDTKVEEVVVENGKTTGVKINGANGEEFIEAERVIVNSIFSDMPALFKEVPPEVKETVDYLDSVQNMDFYIFYRLKDNPFTYNGVVQIVDREGNNHGCISTQSLYMPWSVDKDGEAKHMTVYTKVYPKEEGMKHTKEEVMQTALDLQEDCFPGFKDAFLDSDCITHYPLWQHQFVINRLERKSRSVEDLYFVGDCTRPILSLAVDAAASSGVLLAEELLGKKILDVPGRK